MRHFGWGTVTGLGMAGLLATALPAQAQYGGSSSGSSTSGQQPAGSTSSDTGSSTSEKGSMGSMGSSGTSRDSSMGGTGTSAPSSSATTGTQELTGTVQKFDKDSNELTLSSSDRKLKVSDDTQVMKDGQIGSISDIHEGEQVRASFSGTGDTVQVQRIEVMSAGAKKRTGTYGTAPEAPAPGTPGSTGGAAGAGGGTGGSTTGGGK
jgi:Cu/Ag efflux protein CusF